MKALVDYLSGNPHGFDVKALVLGEEEDILLTPLDEGFSRFLSSFIPYADRLSATLRGRWPASTNL